MVGCARLSDLVNIVDPELVTAAVGMDAQAAMFSLRERVDEDRRGQLDTG